MKGDIEDKFLFLARSPGDREIKIDYLVSFPFSQSSMLFGLPILTYFERLGERLTLL